MARNSAASAGSDVLPTSGGRRAVGTRASTTSTNDNEVNDKPVLDNGPNDSDEPGDTVKSEDGGSTSGPLVKGSFRRAKSRAARACEM
jgi:hypothetical protein